MTSDKAIKFADGKAFELLCQLEACTGKKQRDRINEEFSFINYARRCIEKEVPQKPTNISQEYDGTHGECIRCGRALIDFENFTRCPDCGQALDWSGVL